MTGAFSSPALHLFYDASVTKARQRRNDLTADFGLVILSFFCSWLFLFLLDFWHSAATFGSVTAIEHKHTTHPSRDDTPDPDSDSSAGEDDVVIRHRGDHQKRVHEVEHIQRRFHQQYGRVTIALFIVGFFLDPLLACGLFWLWIGGWLFWLLGFKKILKTSPIFFLTNLRNRIENHNFLSHFIQNSIFFLRPKIFSC